MAEQIESLTIAGNVATLTTNGEAGRQFVEVHRARFERVVRTHIGRQSVRLEVQPELSRGAKELLVGRKGN